MKNKISLANVLIGDERAETAISHLIFFIAAVVIAMGVVMVMSANVQSLTSASSAGSKVLSSQLKTDITIISDPESIPNSSSEYTFYVKNTGMSNLAPEYVDVMLDGSIVMPDDLDVSVMEGGQVWRIGDVLVLNVSTSGALASGDHRLLVSVENGRSDSMEFKV